MACALAAGIAMADTAVESANIVGYQDKPLGNGEYTWACPTFTMVGGQNINFKLGDLIPNDVFDGFTDNIQFCDAEGNWEDQLTYVSQAWLDANDIGEEGYTVGWYKMVDEELSTPLNDTPVAFGQAFCAYAGRDNVTISIPTPLSAK